MNLGYRIVPDVWDDFRHLPAWLQEAVLDDLDDLIRQPGADLLERVRQGDETLHVTLRVIGSHLYRVEITLRWNPSSGVGYAVRLHFFHRHRLL